MPMLLLCRPHFEDQSFTGFLFEDLNEVMHIKLSTQCLADDEHSTTVI